MWSTNSRPFNGPRTGPHGGGGSKTTLSMVIRPSRHSGEANPHPHHARARRRAEGEGAFKISLDVRNKNLSEKRIHQICAWIPARCRGGRRLVARARLWRRPPGRACVADRRFPVFRLLPHCYFSHRRREPKSAALRTTPDCRREANVLETRRKSIGLSAHLRYREEKVSWLGGGRRCFFIVVYNAGCGGSRLQPQPKVERER